MKYLLALCLILSTNAFAEEVKVGCITELPTTTTIARTAGNSVTFEVIHHNGVKYMPIHDGVITPNDLGLLSDRADVMADLGSEMLFSISKDACKFDGFLFDCFGNGVGQTINGHDVRMWAAWSKLSDEVTLSGKFSYITTTIALDIDGKSYYIPMKYNDYECYKDFSKNAYLKKR